MLANLGSLITVLESFKAGDTIVTRKGIYHIDQVNRDPNDRENADIRFQGDGWNYFIRGNYARVARVMFGISDLYEN